MLAVIRPHSSKFAEFISSCIAFGWSGIASCGPDRVSNLNRSPPCWWIRANPSHFAVGVVGAVAQPLAAKSCRTPRCRRLTDDDRVLSRTRTRRRAAVASMVRERRVERAHPVGRGVRPVERDAGACSTP